MRFNPVMVRPNDNDFEFGCLGFSEIWLFSQCLHKAANNAVVSNFSFHFISRRKNTWF